MPDIDINIGNNTEVYFSEDPSREKNFSNDPTVTQKEIEGFKKHIVPIERRHVLSGAEMEIALNDTKKASSVSTSGDSQIPSNGVHLWQKPTRNAFDGEAETHAEEADAGCEPEDMGRGGPAEDK